MEEIALGDDPVTSETAFYEPAALGFDAFGHLYVLDSGNDRVQVFDSGGTYVRTMGGPGQGPGRLSSPSGMWVFADGGVIVADTRNRRLQPFGPGGGELEPMPLEFAPLDVVAARDRLFVLRLPQATMVLGPDARPLVQITDRSGRPVDGFVAPTPAAAGALYLLQNLVCLAPAPGAGLAVSATHVVSRIQIYASSGALRREIPVLYKAGAWAPLGRLPSRINEASVARIARTSTDLAWDPVRRIYWLLAGYTDRTAEGEWIVGQEFYRYGPDGTYRGSAMLPFRATAVAAAASGLIWVIDEDGIVHGFHVRDPDMEPPR